MRIIMNHIYTKENGLGNGLLEVKSVSRSCRIGFNLKYQKVSCSLLVVVSYFMDRDLGKISFFVLIGPPTVKNCSQAPVYGHGLLNFEFKRVSPFYQGKYT